MNKDLIRRGYNESADRYTENRNEFKTSRYLEILSRYLRSGTTILDIGCGSGEPVDKILVSKGYCVIGIDISERQIELAKSRVPLATYLLKDMSELKEKEFLVDAVVSFYAIFHIPRETHQQLFEKIYSFLPEGGLILISMGSSEWEGILEDFHGVKMYWSHYGPEKNREIVKRTGFHIILDEIDIDGGERHQIILAQK